MMEKRQLLESQKELLRIKFARVKLAQAEIDRTVDRIMGELGIPKQELSQWRISSNLEYFERIEIPKGSEEDKKNQ